MVTACTFGGNSAVNDGGDVFMPATLATLTINGTQFTSSFAYDYGGCLYVLSNSTVRNSGFLDCTIGDGEGGAVAAGGGSVWSNVSVVGGRATYDGGGGMYIIGVVSTDPVTLDRVVFNNNTAPEGEHMCAYVYIDVSCACL